jgi:hypothetical protein
MKKFIILAIMIISVNAHSDNVSIPNKTPTGAIDYLDSIATYDASTTSGASRTIQNLTDFLDSHYGINVYSVDSSQADQGVASGGTNKTVYDIVGTVGTSKYAVIVFEHDPVDGNTTTYTWDTSDDFSSNPYIYFYISPGVRLSRTTGDETITFYRPENIIVSKNQQITATNNIRFSGGGTIYPEWWGATGDGSTDDATEMQYALEIVRADGCELELRNVSYRCDSALTLLRSSTDGPEHYVIVGNGATLDFSQSSMTSGDLFSLGATSIGNAHDTGFIDVSNLYIKGPESGNPISTGSPDGTTVGLSLEYCLNAKLSNVHVFRTYKGVYTFFSWPTLFDKCTFNQNYIGAHVGDTSTIGVWNDCSFTESHYGILIMASSGYILNQAFNQPRVESCHIGVQLDTGSTASSYIKNIAFHDIYTESITYDTFRIGLAWTFATPSSRGSDRLASNNNYIWNTTIEGGHWDMGGGWSGSRAPIVFPASEETIIGGNVKIPVEPSSISGHSYKFSFCYLPADGVGVSADSISVGIGEGGVIFNGTDGTIYSDGKWGNITSVSKDGTGDYTITFTNEYSTATSYVVSGSADNAYVSSDNRTAGSVGITVRTDGGSPINRSVVSVSIKGTM